ncbi:MAG TPA: Na/Pi cotransporter family protein [Firmicutes bacterium]|nr:Na/Pi cotransporter family protein [Bacillota bacterium]
MGGLGLFWYGLTRVSHGAEQALGHIDERIQAFTGHPLKALLAGVAVAVVFNSSGATALLTVALVEARLLSLRGAIAIILGANVGTTVVPQLLASSVGDLGLPIAGLGALISLLCRRPRVRSGGEALLGFGLVMLGLATAASALAPCARRVDWDMLIRGTRGTGAGLVIGAVMALVLQSGNAVVAILQGVAAVGGTPLAILTPAVMGLNLGSSMPTLLAALVAGSTGGRRVAVFHVLCNGVGVLALLPLASYLTAFCERLSLDPARQVAHVHSLFNLATTALELPFVSVWERVCLWLIPPSPRER